MNQRVLSRVILGSNRIDEATMFFDQVLAIERLGIGCHPEKALLIDNKQSNLESWAELGASIGAQSTRWR